MKSIKLKKREKYLFVIVILVAIGIFMDIGYRYYQEKIGSIDEQIESRKVFLQKQNEKLSDKSVKARIEDAKNQLSIIDSRLLDGYNPHIALAQLQKILFETAGKLEIKIDTTQVKKTEDLVIYTKIPVEITFITSIDKLKDMLLKIELSKMMLTISDLKLNTDEKNSSKQIQVTMTVAGYIKKEGN